MKRFEFRFLDKLDVAVLIGAFVGRDDLSALAEAKTRSSTHTIEVWEGARKVARVKKGNVALACSDRLCG